MSKKHKCYISYKFEDKKYRDRIVKKFSDIAFVDKSQQETIDSNDPDTIMQIIRDKWLNDSTVTIFLIGTRSAENYQEEKDTRKNFDSQQIIKMELRASLSIGKDGKRNGLLGVVLPEMEKRIYKGYEKCDVCGESIQIIQLNDDTTIQEFWRNYYLIEHKSKDCNHFTNNDEYAILVRYCEFMKNPDYYIDLAYKKRNSKLSNNVRVRKFK